jgi:hypothetical protein
MTNDLKNKCTESLKALYPCLTSKDKGEAARKFRVHKNTVHNYLRGEISDLDMGLKLVEFFNKKVGARVERVHKILSA